MCAKRHFGSPGWPTDVVFRHHPNVGCGAQVAWRFVSDVSKQSVQSPSPRGWPCALSASLLAAETAPAGKPRVAVVYFRKAAGGGCVWPPSSTEELAQPSSC